jgi:hypothetical protein
VCALVSLVACMRRWSAPPEITDNPLAHLDAQAAAERLFDRWVRSLAANAECLGGTGTIT